MAGYFSDERRAIETRFTDAWLASSFATVPVAFENVELVPPNPPEYVALYLRNGNTAQVTIGHAHARVRYSGIIAVLVFVPKGVGTQRGRQIAEAVAEIFDGVAFSDGASGRIVCARTAMTPLPAGEHYQQFDVTTPYTRDVVAAA